MAKLNTTVVVDGVLYGPGEVDSKIAARISNPKVWDGKTPSNAGSAVKPLTVNNAPTAQADPANQAPAVEPDPGTSGDGGVEIPPKGGAGSGEPAWRAYADAKSVDVSEAKTRDEIVAALEAAGVPTEAAAVPTE